jgi:DNA-binding transcriptional ArsR family regulator
MTQGLPDLPDDLASKVEFDEQYGVQDHHIVAVFLRAEAPYLSVGTLAMELDMSKQGVRNRLSSLEERGVVDSAPGANGRIYWVADERSEWPIPPDVEVVPVPDDPTVSEVLERRDVVLAVLATGLAVLCAVSIMGLIAVDQFGSGDGPISLALAWAVVVSGGGFLLAGTGSLLSWAAGHW